MSKDICLSLQSNLVSWLDIYNWSAKSLFSNLEHGRENFLNSFIRHSYKECVKCKSLDTFRISK